MAMPRHLDFQIILHRLSTTNRSTNAINIHAVQSGRRRLRFKAFLIKSKLAIVTHVSTKMRNSLINVRLPTSGELLGWWMQNSAVTAFWPKSLTTDRRWGRDSDKNDATFDLGGQQVVWCAHYNKRTRAQKSHTDSVVVIPTPSRILFCGLLPEHPSTRQPKQRKS